MPKLASGLPMTLWEDGFLLTLTGPEGWSKCSEVTFGVAFYAIQIL